MSRVHSQKDIGILIIRVVIGLSMIAFHGLPKLMGGADRWEKLGLSMQNLGINFFPMFWGFSAAITETLGALLIVLGLWTKPSAVLLAITMLVAGMNHLAKGDGLSGASHAFELMAICIALVFLGAGRYSIDKK